MAAERDDIELLSVDEFMSRYAVGRTETYALINRGMLAAKKWGRRTRILRRSAEKWAASLPDVAPGSLAPGKPGRRRA